jgi:hypothetical protein
MNAKIFFGILILALMTFSCEKGPGRGGSSTIRGKLTVREYNRDFTILRDTYPGAMEDVYIIYGDDMVYGDKFEANYDGTYEFNYLREGRYKVFAYSKDSTLNYDITSKEIPVIKEVEITGKDQVIEAPEIIILK